MGPRGWAPWRPLMRCRCPQVGRAAGEEAQGAELPPAEEEAAAAGGHAGGAAAAGPRRGGGVPGGAPRAGPAEPAAGAGPAATGAHDEPAGEARCQGQRLGPPGPAPAWSPPQTRHGAPHRTRLGPSRGVPQGGQAESALQQGHHRGRWEWRWISCVTLPPHPPGGGRGFSLTRAPCPAQDSLRLEGPAAGPHRVLRARPNKGDGSRPVPPAHSGRRRLRDRPSWELTRGRDRAQSGLCSEGRGQTQSWEELASRPCPACGLEGAQARAHPGRGTEGLSCAAVSTQTLRVPGPVAIGLT